jgi:ankyrin repeat protein
LGHEAVVSLILDGGVDPNAEDVNSPTPISFAAENESQSMVLLLLGKGALLDEGQEDSPLM